VVSIDSRPKGSGTAVEVLGDPLNVVAFIANKLADYGRCLRAGMIVMTGSAVDAVPVAPGSSVLAEFSRIGSVGLRLTK
jgi:2-keto-4-pentenoate hydratase